jgi:hypothetical protein
VNIVKFAVGNMDKTRYIAPKVKQRMHLYRPLGGPKMRPGEYRQAKVDRRRIESIDSLRQVRAEALASVEAARLLDRALREV